MQIPLSVNPNGKNVIVVLGVFLGLDYLVVFARFWARHIKRRPFEFNDWAMIVALASVTALYFVEVVAVRNGGVGLHVAELVVHWGGMPTIFTAGKLVLTADILWNLSTLTIKMSILHLYISIFGLTSPRFRKTVWAVMGFCILSTVVFVIQILVLCRPLPFFWDKSIVDGKCGSLPLTYLIPGIIITLEDVAVLALPMPLLWKLKLKTSKKMGAIFIFGIGLIICLISGVRLKYVIELDTEDFTASIWMFAILGTMEPMLGIISACLPVVPSIIAHHSDRRAMALTSKGNSSNASKSYGSRSTKVSNSSHAEHPDFERLSDYDYSFDNSAKPMGPQTHVVGGNWNKPSSKGRSAINVTRQYAIDSYQGRQV
ncbi:hypothetical protein K504DRAFT_440054 [Pleomassaria siparia CBS 279.74]|uniref:Rhodopsin domain-containing protein n=1 Tax=Pleomassaria siparia CBS 279.74 TaxID=1314801 RepID=A0A6G1JYR2_9PLEO|nr:hypothetical protein K504DRAFT_440054 [Pleomassaria siparia CBS 279.74]